MVYENTEFSIDDTRDRDDCGDCNGSGLEFGIHACCNEFCYFGKIMTPHEKHIQEIIYAMHGKLWRAQNAVETFEKSPLLLRWGYALRGKIDARFHNLGGHQVILSDRKGVPPEMI